MAVLKQSFYGLSLKTSCYIIGWTLMTAAILLSLRLASDLSTVPYTNSMPMTSHRHHATTAVENCSAAVWHANMPCRRNMSTNQKHCFLGQSLEECRVTYLLILSLNILIVVPANVLLLKGTTTRLSGYLIAWLLAYFSVAFTNLLLIFSSAVLTFCDSKAGWSVLLGTALHFMVVLYLWLLVHRQYANLIKKKRFQKRVEHMLLSVIHVEATPRQAAPRESPQPPPEADDAPSPEDPVPPPTYAECRPLTSVAPAK